MIINFDNTIQLVNQALDLALMRQTAIASNIANINTREYKTMSVEFENQMNPVYQQTDKPNLIDEQIAASIENATQYRALIKGINHKLAIMKLAIQGNNT
jgi:flagellar basal-body rod protein FlgB